LVVAGSLWPFLLTPMKSFRTNSDHQIQQSHWPEKKIQAYTQPYYAEHWKLQSLSTIFIGPLKFCQTLYQISLSFHST
jgi:hypothetical protein